MNKLVLFPHCAMSKQLHLIDRSVRLHINRFICSVQLIESNIPFRDHERKSRNTDFIGDNYAIISCAHLQLNILHIRSCSMTTSRFGSRICA